MITVNPAKTKRRLFRMAAGWFFIVLGILGLFLPILQGFLFLAVGAFLLAPYIPVFRKIRSRLYAKYPKIHHTIDKMKQSWYSLIGRKQATRKVNDAQN